MKEKDDNVLSRRKFMQLAATVVSGTALTGAGVLYYKNWRSNFEELEMVWYLNPAFRVSDISNNELELFTHLSDGKILKHKFRGLEADILRQIEKESKIAASIEGLANKYNLSLHDCRNQISKSIKEFNEARLIYYGEKMLVKVVGA